MNELGKIIFDDVESVCREVDFSQLDAGKTILITGASGLIGNYFLACLRRVKVTTGRKFNVIAVMGHEPASYLKELIDFEGAQVVVGELTDPDFCRSLPEADFIIHAAGYGQPGKFMEDQVKTLKINSFCTFLLFEKLKSEGKFLFVSTSEVYSGSPNIPYRETDIGTTDPSHARACYIEGKRCGEAICNAYRARGVAAKSARLSLAYGPGTKRGDARVLNSLIAKGLQGKVSLMDQGEARRTYCYVTDAVQIMWKVLFLGKDAVYNVGGDSKTTIRDLAVKIGNYLGVPVAFPEKKEDVAQANKGAPSDVRLDMSKVAAEFGKQDFVSLDVGLKKTIDWQKSLYKSNE